MPKKKTRIYGKRKGKRFLSNDARLLPGRPNAKRKIRRK